MAFLNINQVRKIMVWLDSDIKDAKREVDLVEVNPTVFCVFSVSLFVLHDDSNCYSYTLYE